MASESIDLKVLPLPEEGKPADFSGLVGQFTMESELQPATVTMGESTTMTVRVSGKGNVKRIPDLKFTALKAAKIYADQPLLKVEQDENGHRGEKIMKWALVPEKKGRIEIPSLELSFFNPKTQKYTILTSPSHALSVLPADIETKVSSGPVKGSEDIRENTGKQEVKALGRDILPIHTSLRDLSVQSHISKNRPLVFIVLLCPLFLYMAAFFALKLKKQKIESIVQTRSKKAAREFAKQCGLDGLRHQDLMDAVRDYLNNRFALSIGALTSEEAAGILRSKKISPDTTEKLRSCVQMLENAVYTGKGHEKTDQAKALSDLIKTMEKEIR